MAVYNLSSQHSLVSNWMSEIRSTSIQKDRMRFRRNLERIAEVIAYEISKTLSHQSVNIETPLGVAPTQVLQQQPVLATILRAGLPMHVGLLNYFDNAENAFISAYRKHNEDGSFEIALEYMSCPEVNGKDIIVCDPMLATGASLVKSVQFLKNKGNLKSLNIACAIASTAGIQFVQNQLPEANIWCGGIDDEITNKGYIVPGLGDAGDLAYGPKLQF